MVGVGGVDVVQGTRKVQFVVVEDESAEVL